FCQYTAFSLRGNSFHLSLHALRLIFSEGVTTILTLRDPAVVVDLFSRKIIGWSMQSRMTKDIVLNALLMAVWRRNLQKQVLVHSDQGSQYTSHEGQSFLKSHGLEGSMSRRGNCHDNVVAESFFQLLKRERIKKKFYGTREEARSDIFDYIEMFYNSKRRHGSGDQMSPTEYENQYYQRPGSVQIIRGDSRRSVKVI
ncbi:IS3 family transposase, partial [Escherichia coli]|uniref:IS3 family transposase n=1 Tax=Escherichia coli TaxID=562 RepID=UPI0021BEF360